MLARHQALGTTQRYIETDAEAQKRLVDLFNSKQGKRRLLMEPPFSHDASPGVAINPNAWLIYMARIKNCLKRACWAATMVGDRALSMLQRYIEADSKGQNRVVDLA